MAIFKLKKKEEKSCCCCSDSVQKTATANVCCNSVITEIHSVKVLGAGCKSCHIQYENVKEALLNMGISVEVEYITDMQKIMAYGVMSMPALVVNEDVVSMGKVLKVADVEKLIFKLGFDIKF